MIGIAAGAAAVIVGAGITAVNNNSDSSPAITIEISSGIPASSPILPTGSATAEPEEAVSVPEKETEILAVNIEPEQTTSVQTTTTAAPYSPAAETTYYNTPETTSEKPPETAASTAPVTTKVSTTATTEPAKAVVTISEKHSQTVYIAASGKGSKYHRSPDCSNMKGANAISVDDAKARGYTACKKCY